MQGHHLTVTYTSRALTLVGTPPSFLLIDLFITSKFARVVTLGLKSVPYQRRAKVQRDNTSSGVGDVQLRTLGPQ